MSDIELEIFGKKDTELLYDKSFINKVYKRTERVCNGLFYILTKIHKKDTEVQNDIIRQIQSLIPIILKDASNLLLEDSVSVKRELVSFEMSLMYLSSLLAIATTAEYIQASYAGLLQLEIDGIVDELSSLRTKNREVKVLKNSVSQRRSRSDSAFSPQSGSVDDVRSPLSVLRTSTPERKERIRTILQEKGQVSIKDISDIIKDVSEKSIQRDLNDLIDSGAVVRIGERRWSTYKLS